MGARLRVCLLIEGSYPFITGGVSAWVDQLIHELSDIDFVLFTISPEADQPLRYKIPENVTGRMDLVLSKPPHRKKGPGNKRSLLEEIKEIHKSFFLEIPPGLDELIGRLPEGYYLHRDAINSIIGWEMITTQNLKKNPVYPFSDYFWAWKSAHDMMFTVLGACPPDADLYHAVSTGYAGLAGLAAKIRKGKPFLLTEHGLYHKEREMEIKRAKFIWGYQRDMWIKTYNNLSRLSYRYADLIISLFEYNRRKQLELGAPESKTRVIPNGIDVARFISVKRTKREGFHVGLVGRVVPIKDIKTFIACAKIISTFMQDVDFYCIGPEDEDPGYFEDCKILVNSFRLTESFHFTGRQDVRRYYAFLDVLLLTSVREAQPLVILEAFCSGVPVVATRVGNVPELLDYDERFLASAKDPEKLAQGVKYIHDNPEEIQNLVEKNREKVLTFYNRQEVYRTYRAIYRKFGAA
ncbi:D-inositol-3-phosphate glycosyltransferase [subsurface metagenome]